jgi:hypothetical protein
MPLPDMQDWKNGFHQGTAPDTFTGMGLFLQNSGLFLNNNSFFVLDANGKTMPGSKQKNRITASNTLLWFKPLT